MKNFAEKWNRPDGNKYREAILRSGTRSSAAFSLGPESFVSNEMAHFNRPLNESYLNIGQSTVNNTLRRFSLRTEEILPGAKLGKTGNFN